MGSARVRNEIARSTSAKPSEIVSGNDCSIFLIALSNGFSKKAENHPHSVAIHFMHYNFVRTHQSLRITPAMAAGVTPKLWSLTDMVRVIEDWEIARSLKISDKTMVG